MAIYTAFETYKHPVFEFGVRDLEGIWTFFERHESGAIGENEVVVRGEFLDDLEVRGLDEDVARGDRASTDAANAKELVRFLDREQSLK